VSRLLKYISWWPPLLGAGIKVTRMDPDFRAVDVEMRLTRWNRNYMGVHYGGSLYSMTDPFYMVMMSRNLGPEYIVWDKAASIRYRKPGRGTVYAQFRLTAELIEEVRAELETAEKMEPKFLVQVKDDAGEIVAEVERLLYCARKSVHDARIASRRIQSER
jgi:hypothetical protein